MTNAIEQAKREMYRNFEIIKNLIEDGAAPTLMRFGEFESAFESYLELLRQDHEALHETARKRFEDLQAAEAANQELAAGLKSSNETMVKCATHSAETIKDLESQLANMTVRRDYFRNQVQSANHAYKTQQERTATPAQDSGDRASCATPDAKTMALAGAVEDVRAQICSWVSGDVRARKAMAMIAHVVNGSPEVFMAVREVAEKNEA